MSNLLYATEYVAADNNPDKSFMDQVMELTQNARKRQTEIMQRKLEREFSTAKPTTKPVKKTNKPTKKPTNKKS